MDYGPMVLALNLLVFSIWEKRSKFKVAMCQNGSHPFPFSLMLWFIWKLLAFPYILPTTICKFRLRNISLYTFYIVLESMKNYLDLQSLKISVIRYPWFKYICIVFNNKTQNYSWWHSFICIDKGNERISSNRKNACKICSIGNDMLTGAQHGSEMFLFSLRKVEKKRNTRTRTRWGAGGRMAPNRKISNFMQCSIL